MNPQDKIEKKIQEELNFSAGDKLRDRILRDIQNAHNKSTQTQPAYTPPTIWRIPLWSKAGYLAAAFLIVSSLATCFVLSRKNADLRDELELARQDIAAAPIDDSVTINFYLKEHQDFIARQASLNSAASQQIQMQISLDDLLYYEFLDDQSELLNPGIIVRGSSSQQEIDPSGAPAISNGHTLTLSEAQEAADFDLVSPLWLEPCYTLDQIRRIEGCDTMQLLYTDGINSISLFEQPLDGQRVLSPQDFREYAVYRNKEQTRGTILAWRDGTLSYVLIGNIELPQLMNMAQSISAGK